MKVRTQITLDLETQKLARRRASEIGVSLAEYVRRVLERDLVSSRRKADVASIFDLGSSGGSDIASKKDAMIGEAIEGSRKKMRKTA
jgi:hypothetical protein